MKYVFRDNVVFEYDPETKRMSAGEECADGYETNVFNYCNFIKDDYKLLSQFFDRAYQHASGSLHESFLSDIEVY